MPAPISTPSPVPIDPKEIEEWKAQAARGEMFDGMQGDAIIPALLREHDDLIALLRKIEWCGDPSLGAWCPSCRGINPAAFTPGVKGILRFVPTTVGHTPDCRLAAFLKGQP
jgi:hypothetical protein